MANEVESPVAGSQELRRGAREGCGKEISGWLGRLSTSWILRHDIRGCAAAE